MTILVGCRADESGLAALSLAALEGLRPDTLYAATTGGIGRATEDALIMAIAGLAALPHGVLAAATDADAAGERYASRLQTLAAEAGVACVRLMPPDGFNDWNDALRARDAGDEERKPKPKTTAA